MNVHVVNDVRHTEIHTAAALVSEPSAFEFRSAIEDMKSHKSPCNIQIPTDFIKAGGRTIRNEIHNLIISIWNKEKFPEQ